MTRTTQGWARDRDILDDVDDALFTAETQRLPIDRPEPVPHAMSGPPKDSAELAIAVADGTDHRGSSDARTDAAETDPTYTYLTTLVQRLFPAADGARAATRSVLFATIDQTPGISQLAIDVAEHLLIRARGPVCLIDAKFGHPTLHRHYNAGNDKGLTELLRETEPVVGYPQRVITRDRSSLWLLPAGGGDSRIGSAAVAAHLGRAALPRGAEQGLPRLRQLIAVFDFVVIDAPAVNGSTVAAMLGPQVDGAVLVAEANLTKRQGARIAAATLRDAGARVLGTVLNNRTFPIPEALYRLL